MTRTVRFVVSLFLAAVAAGSFLACQHDAGPSLSIAIEGRRLEPSATVPNAAALCCCRVRGSVHNTSAIAVHAELRFHASNAKGESLGTAVDWVKDIPAGGSKSFDAAGIVALCSEVAKITDDPLAYGVYNVK